MSSRLPRALRAWHRIRVGCARRCEQAGGPRRVDEAGIAAGTGEARADIVKEAAAAMRCNLHLHQEG